MSCSSSHLRFGSVSRPRVSVARGEWGKEQCVRVWLKGSKGARLMGRRKMVGVAGLAWNGFPWPLEKAHHPSSRSSEDEGGRCATTFRQRFAVSAFGPISFAGGRQATVRSSQPCWLPLVYGVCMYEVPCSNGTDLTLQWMMYVKTPVGDRHPASLRAREEKTPWDTNLGAKPDQVCDQPFGSTLAGFNGLARYGCVALRHSRDVGERGRLGVGGGRSREDLLAASPWRKQSVTSVQRANASRVREGKRSMCSVRALSSFSNLSFPS